MQTQKLYTATRNACKICNPAGASIAFKGIEGCVPLIHGSQGCATYIRRYLISHYKEPVDIASTSFSESSAVFGGEKNMFTALKNVTRQYKPILIGVATTCLSETIGDDMESIINRYQREMEPQSNQPDIVFVNSPSYSGTHADGFHNTILALLTKYAHADKPTNAINIMPGMVSPADIRMLKTIVDDFHLPFIMIPDYSDTLDNGYTGDYETLPPGGTPLQLLKQTGASKASIEFGYILNKSAGNNKSAAHYLEQQFGVKRYNLNWAVGIHACDKLMDVLVELSGNDIPALYQQQRSRLVDSYVDGHKYLFGKKAVIYGEEDFVVAMMAFLEEIGIETVICASGGNSTLLKATIDEHIKPKQPVLVKEDDDFEDIALSCKLLKPDIMIGNSKGYYIARELGIPLVRVGFPIHDRIGGQRIKHLGYEGTQELFDRITNALIEYTQDHSPVGYKYI